eukprot:jgi/Botrbrau1/1602/Bobra.0185s0017.1
MPKFSQLAVMCRFVRSMMCRHRVHTHLTSHLIFSGINSPQNIQPVSFYNAALPTHGSH